MPPNRRDATDEFGQVVLQWESSPHADCTADAVVAVLLQEQGPPPAIGAAEAARKCVPHVARCLISAVEVQMRASVRICEHCMMRLSIA